LEKISQQIVNLQRDKTLKEVELEKQKALFRAQRLEAENLRKNALLLVRDRDLQHYRLLEKTAAFKLREKDLALEKSNKVMFQNKLNQAERVNEQQTKIRNLFLVAFTLVIAIGFLSVKRIQAKKTEITLRAEAAEYQAQAAELQARASETEMLRLQAESERHRREAQQEFSRRLIASQEKERSRMARELHDQLGQDLVFIRNSMLVALDEGRVSESVAEAAQTAGTVLENVRRLARDLRPLQLDRYGLTNALEAMITRIGKSSPTRFVTLLDPLDGLFSKDEEINVFRIVQESASNILRHAAAKEATIRVVRSDRMIELVIEDDGRGFDAAEESWGFGLLGMKQRVELLRGTMQVRSSPGAGAKIMVALPLDGDARCGADALATEKEA
jgi:signal transduction histidine kinase